MGEQDNIALDGPRFFKHTIDPCADFSWLFSTRAAISKEQPARGGRMDLGWRQSLIAPVVPLHQVSVNGCHISETGQPAGIPGSLQRAGKGKPERLFRQNRQ
jgi:hypothetical protein